MHDDFHIGNRKSTVAISDPGIPKFRGGNYNADMQDEIGTKRPVRLHIRSWAKSKGFDQKRLAEQMRIEPGTLSKLLSGSMEMTTTYLGRIADALDVSVTQLFNDPEALDPARIPPEDLELALRFADLPKEVKDGILQIALHLPPQPGAAPRSVAPRLGPPKPTGTD